MAEQHYDDLKARPFFAGLVKYISSGTPVIAMVWEGKDVIKQGRSMIGATNPLDASPGSIRGQYCVSIFFFSCFSCYLLLFCRSLLVVTLFTVPIVLKLLKRKLVCGSVRLVSSLSGLLLTLNGFNLTTKLCFNNKNLYFCLFICVIYS